MESTTLRLYRLHAEKSKASERGWPLFYRSILYRRSIGHQPPLSCHTDPRLKQPPCEAAKLDKSSCGCGYLLRANSSFSDPGNHLCQTLKKPILSNTKKKCGESVCDKKRERRCKKMKQTTMYLRLPVAM